MLDRDQSLYNTSAANTIVLVEILKACVADYNTATGDTNCLSSVCETETTGI